VGRWTSRCAATAGRARCAAAHRHGDRRQRNPARAEIPGLKNFAGQVVHSHGYDDASEWQGRDALVIGTGNSGHDIAQDLYSSGRA